MKSLLCVLLPLVCFTQSCVHREVPAESALSDAVMRTDSELKNEVIAANTVEKKVIRFPFDKEVLTAVAETTLKEVGNEYHRSVAFQAGRRFALEVDCHCDLQGPDAYNMVLSTKRAHSVRSYLVGMGVPYNAIKISTWGRRKPLIRQNSIEAHRINRRAEVSLTVQS